MFAAQNEFAPDKQARVHAFCHAVPNAWHAMGVMLSAAGSLTWLHDVAAPDTSYDELLAMANAWPAGTKISSSSPTSPASARPTPIRTPGARSPG